MIFVTAGLVSEILLLFFIQFLLIKRNVLRNSILRVFIAAFFSVLSNIIIAISRISLITNFAFALYFSSIDFITYFLLIFTFIYTNRDKYLKKITKIWRIVIILDTLNLHASIFTGHMFTMYSMKLADGSVAYQTTPTLLFNVHLVLCYIPIVTALALLSYSFFKSHGFYRLKYFPIFASVLAIVLLNVAYMYFSLPFDWSVEFYALAGLLLFFFSLYFVPRMLMNNTLKLAVDSMNEAILLFDAERNIIYINKRAHDLFNLSEESFSFGDYPISVWLKGKDFDNLDNFVQNYPMTVAGEDMVIKVDYRNCVNAKGQHLGSFFLFEDVTLDQNLMQSLEAARSEANQANSAKSIFLANMSHEIRTPINSILGMNEMIIREATDEHVLEYARDIERSGDALMSLINNILDFSKIESGKMEINPAPYSVFKTIRECFHLVAPRAQQKDLPIRISCADDIPCELLGDTQRIKQILVNLLTNAIKYTAQGYISLDVSWKKTTDYVGTLVFVVSDTGQGISEENISKLFNIFQRIDEGKNRNIEGTGLGLAISRQLAVMMNGNISVKSDSGKGSEFTVELKQPVINNAPLGKFLLQEEAAPAKKTYKESFHAPGAKILVVDDIELNLKLVSSLLKKTRVQISKASDGNTAIKMCSEEEYDLILMDHMMPDPDGYETMVKIRAAGGHNAVIPIVVLTANALEGVEKQYMEMGFDGYLSKPILGSDLEEALIRFLPQEKITIL